MVQNLNPKAEEYCVEFYGLKSKKLITSVCKKGKGPNEFMAGSPKYFHIDDYFWVHDMTLKTFHRFHIDSTLKIGDKYISKRFKLPTEAMKAFPYKDDKLICANRWYMESDRFKHGVDKFFITKGDGKDSINFPTEELVYPANVTGVNIFTSPNEKRTIMADRRDDKIEIYDKNLNLLKTLKGPDNYKLKYAYGGAGICFAEGKWSSYYFPGFYTDDAVYLLYMGFQGIDSEDVCYQKVEVFKISWEGELLHRYALDGYMFSLSVDSNEEYFYGTTQFEYAGARKLVRYKLK